MAPRTECPRCGRLNFIIVTELPTGEIQALEPHMRVLWNLAVEFDNESGAELWTARDFADAVALTVKAALDTYVKPAGNPNQVGSKRRNAA